MTEARSLEAFAAAQPVERRCWTCNIPERDEVNAAKGRIPVGVMVAWLQSRGHEEATAARLNFHFSARHHVLGG